MEHHLGLAAAYGTAVVGRALSGLAFARFRHVGAAPRFERPWLEMLFALLAGVAVIGVGQLYVRGFLLTPETSILVASANQILVFSPVLLLPVLRRQGPETLYAPIEGLGWRILLGLGLALAALGAYSLARGGTPSCGRLLGEVASAERVPVAVQVLLEDLAIGLLLCRLAAALRRPAAAGAVVAALFVAGHVPALLATGASMADLASLGLDLALALGVVIAIVRTRDIVWFFPVHCALDVTQFVTTG